MPLVDPEQHAGHDEADEKADQKIEQVPVERSVMMHIENPFRSEPDFSGYADPYGFAPLPTRLETTLAKMVDEGGFDSRENAVELEELGYVRDLVFYFRQYAKWEITPKGKSYASDKAEYEKRRDAWAKRQKQNERGKLVRDLLMASVGAIVGAVAGAIATALIIG